MDVNWFAGSSAFGLLVVALLIWFGLKFVARIALAVLAALVIGVLFFGLSIGDLGLKSLGAS